MKKIISFCCVASLTVGLLTVETVVADPFLFENPKVKVRDKAAMQAYAFDLRDVRLLGGVLLRAQQLDEQYLLELDSDRLLHNFRQNAGLPSAATPLGGWEDPNCEVRGHFVGHYLSACALMYAATGNARFKEKGDAVVCGLGKCQAKLDSGYLSAFPEKFFDRVEARKQVWAPYYTLHKIYAGLLDMYVHCDNREALDICGKFADWLIARNAKLTDEKMQAMLGNEHGGMNEVLANLYGLTGEEKYLKIAERFNHYAVIDPAVRGEDRLTGLHANTQIPKFIGTARQYELTGEDRLKTASLFFWNTVVNERSYVIGGHSDGEMFTPREHLSEALGPNTTETCNTYNMLKLTRHLFCWDPRAQYADYYERALVNHILSSQDPDSGMMCYYVPLRPGSHKEYNGKFDGFWCCTGTGVENHAKYADSIYFHDGRDTLFVNLFLASELNWKAKRVKIRQETRFPDEGLSRIVVACDEPTTLRLCVRHPSWAGNDFSITVNGEKVADVGKPGGYAVVQREWKNGDRLEIASPFHLRTEAFRDNPRRFAVLDGPLVLGAQVNLKKPFPVVVADDGKILPSLKPMADRPSTFRGAGDVFRVPGERTQDGVVLEPFYKIHAHRDYQVYWDQFTADQWNKKEEDYKAAALREKEFEARTVDRVNPGEEQDERNHRQHGEHTSAGDFGDRKYRHATDGGWFSWEMKVLRDEPQLLRVTYWGSDHGNRDFDIFVDDEKLATQTLNGKMPGLFFEEEYRMSEAMLKGKDTIVVKFQAHRDAWAGGVFGIRVMCGPEKKGETTLKEQP
jgi:uncharacterized protein